MECLEAASKHTSPGGQKTQNTCGFCSVSLRSAPEQGWAGASSLISRYFALGSQSANLRGARLGRRARSPSLVPRIRVAAHVHDVGREVLFQPVFAVGAADA